MRIVVLAGSPKGKISVTMQYVRYLQRHLSAHEVSVLQVAQPIKKLEKRGNAFDDVVDQVRRADGVLWAFPVYFMLCPSQYKRFIELIWERGAAEAFEGKQAAVLTTSIHFFDHTAHAYMRAVCDDLGMNFAGAFSAEMKDLLLEERREGLRYFGESLVRAMKDDLPSPRRYLPLPASTLAYEPGPVETAADAGAKKVVILHDARGQGNLAKMVDRMRASFSGDVTVVDLHDVDIKGGCQGCIRCGLDNRCAYVGKDGFIDFFEGTVKAADILILAARTVDRAHSSRWRLFFDRSFYNTHIPVLEGRHFGFLVAGPLGGMPHLRQLLQGYGEGSGANVVDFISDEVADSSTLDGLLSALAHRLVDCARGGYVAPPTFLAVGGRKIFRDEIFLTLRPIFQADYRHFKEHGYFDFPTRRLGARLLTSLLATLVRLPFVRRRFQKRMKREMIRTLARVAESAE